VAIVVNGSDPYEHDELQSTDKLKLTREQLLARDIMVYEFLKDRKIPQSYIMAGGYGKRSWEIYTQFLKFVWESSSKRSEVSSR
jgi:acetoin utilization deacetylase AcuC-like enzyme